MNDLWRGLTVRYQNVYMGKGVSYSRLRYALFVLFIGGILAYGAAFAGYMLVNFDLLNIIRDANEDDAFYYFQIAYYLSEGKFSTFDGGITQTNGYHPLWLLLITPFYWVFDKETALFAIKAFEIMLVAGGVALIAVAARLARLPWILLFALLPILYQTGGLLLGLEAAAALFMLGLLFLALLLYARNPGRWTWPLAVVAFALPWARLEYIAISLSATALMLLLECSRRERTDGASWRAALIPSFRALVPIISAVAGILTYFAYNKLVFGGIAPVSGASKRAWSQEKWESEGGYSLFQNFREVLQIPAFNYEALLAALAICAGFLLAWWLARRYRSREDWLPLVFLAGVFSLAAEHIAKFAQTVLQVHPAWGGYIWYFVPAYLMLALAVPLICYVAIHFLRRLIGPRSARGASVLCGVIVFSGAVLLFTKADFTGPFRWVDRSSQSTHRDWELTSYVDMQVVNRALPEDSVIGSTDAGVIGYFSRFPVVNLDGLVNSYDYLRAINASKDGSVILKKEWIGKEELMPLYRELGITHFANLQLANQPRDAVLFAGSPYLYRGVGELRFKLWPVESTGDVDSAAWVWQRMEPHFNYQADGVGLLVNGRMAQAFVRDCATDELAVWSWSSPADESIVKFWTNTETGLCVDTVVLPRNALHPVRVEAMAVDDYLSDLVGDRQPVIRSDFDVYLSGNTLVYVRETCERGDTEARFFLHLWPVDGDNLPGDRRRLGFDNLDFDFVGRGAVFDGRCVAMAVLPGYDIARIGTGQYVRAGGGYKQLWEGEIRLNE